MPCCEGCKPPSYAATKKDELPGAAMTCRGRTAIFGLYSAAEFVKSTRVETTKSRQHPEISATYTPAAAYVCSTVNSPRHIPMTVSTATTVVLTMTNESAPSPNSKTGSFRPCTCSCCPTVIFPPAWSRNGWKSIFHALTCKLRATNSVPPGLQQHRVEHKAAPQTYQPELDCGARDQLPTQRAMVKMVSC
eukprot:1276152-Rhodomonas_salina.1